MKTSQFFFVSVLVALAPHLSQACALIYACLWVAMGLYFMSRGE